MSNGKTVRLEQQVACLRREIGYRERVYPGLVSRGKMRPAEAEYEIATMGAALKTLQFVQRHRTAIAQLAEGKSDA
jgi:hypothetical protein